MTPRILLSFTVLALIVIDSSAHARPRDGQSHWAFQPVEKHPPPEVATVAVRSPIDRFIAARLEAASVNMSPAANSATLLRRVRLDLTGLPPSPRMVGDFTQDESPDTYEQAVDRSLASPHFGERWGRHWLDLARYADSHGYTIDGARQIWKYRDWVINALNADMPFDQFTTEQLAGDLLPKPGQEQLIATGFHRNTQINQEGGVDKEQFRIEDVADRVDTTGTVWLGLSVGCARCHDHKFDPLSQQEYYEFFAFFNDIDDKNLKITDKISTMIIGQRAKPRETHVLLGGDFLRPGDPVSPDTPDILHASLSDNRMTRLDLAHWLTDKSNPLTARVTVNRFWMRLFGLGIVETENDFGTQGTPASHPEMLDWLALEFQRHDWSVKDTLREIVTSATYRQSSRVREDLDRVDPRNLLVGRQNRLRLEAEVVRDVALTTSGLLTRQFGGPGVFPPQPDGVYSFTQVNKKWQASTGADRFRRGLYTHFWRSAPHPALTAFDAPDASLTCSRRTRSNTPLQALTLLNDRGFLEYAHALAGRLLKETGDDSERIHSAFLIALGREPSEREQDLLMRYLAEQREDFAGNPNEAKEVLATGGVVNIISGVSDAERAAWVMTARVVMNLDEFITRE